MSIQANFVDSIDTLGGNKQKINANWAVSFGGLFGSLATLPTFTPGIEYAPQLNPNSLAQRTWKQKENLLGPLLKNGPKWKNQKVKLRKVGFGRVNKHILLARASEAPKLNPKTQP